MVSTPALVPFTVIGKVFVSMSLASARVCDTGCFTLTPSSKAPVSALLVKLPVNSFFISHEARKNMAAVLNVMIWVNFIIICLLK